MAFRQLPQWCVGELLRRWQAGQERRKASRETGVDRKTVGRYWSLAEHLAIPRDRELADAEVQWVAARAQDRPSPVSDQHAQLVVHRQRIAKWLARDRKPLNLCRVHALLGREGVNVSYSTLYRFAVGELGWAKRNSMLSPALRQKAQVLLEAGHPHKDVAERCKTSVRMVRRVAQEIAVAQTADAVEARQRAVGRPSQTAPVADQVAEWIAAKPHLETRELLRRAKLAGYTGKKSAFYALVRDARAARTACPNPRCRPGSRTLPSTADAREAARFDPRGRRQREGVSPLQSGEAPSRRHLVRRAEAVRPCLQCGGC